MRDRPKVGEILIQAGILEEAQLATALVEQSRWGRRLGMTLIKLGMVQEGQLVRALARQFDLPVASLSGKKIAPEVIALVPAKFACEHSVVPLFVKKEGRKEQLFLGMEEPSDLSVLDDLAFRTGMSIRPVMVGPSEIGEAIDRYYNAKPAAAPPKRADAVAPGDTLSETNLRRVKEDAAPSLSQLLTPPPAPTPVANSTGVVAATEAELRPIESKPYESRPFDASLADWTPSEPAPVAAAEAPATPMPAYTAPAPAPEPAEAITSPVVAPQTGPVGLDAARVLEETERTRLVAKAIAHLLIEKGLLTLDELQARIEKMKGVRPGGSM